jgi:hypothetical protein
MNAGSTIEVLSLVAVWRPLLDTPAHGCQPLVSPGRAPIHLTAAPIRLRSVNVREAILAGQVPRRQCLYRDSP